MEVALVLQLSEMAEFHTVMLSDSTVLLKREIDHRLATHFHPAALSAQIAEVGQTEGKSQAKLLLK